MSFLGSITKAVTSSVSDITGGIVGDIAGKTLGKGLSSLLQDGIGGLLGKGFNLGGGLGNIAEKICDSLLPKELESVGDLVSMAINCSQGNYPAAIQDGLDLLQDAPALLEKLGNNAANVPGFTPWSIGSLLNGLSEPSQTSNPTSFTSIGQKGETASTTANSTTVASPSSTPVSDKPKVAETTSKATASTKKPSTDSKPKVAETSSKATAGTKKPSTDGKVSESEGAAAAKAFLDAHPNPEDLMAQIRDGKIPPEVMNSPSGMMALQQKLNNIQMMNQLMTQMLKTLHDMNMAIVQNMRV